MVGEMFMNLKNIGNNVKTLRLASGMTQAQLAEKADMSTVHMSHIETGSVAMSIDSLINISNALSTTPDSILWGEFNLTDDKTQMLLSRKIQEMTPDENRLIIEFIDLVKRLNINK